MFTWKRCVLKSFCKLIMDGVGQYAVFGFINSNGFLDFTKKC